ncbi:hypothetical protein [Paraburkholderia sp. UCT70]|uniref:hypothetical protein n=1 Tax=Paraburkholderia sp. UCT70 TaxID=2991068 RepID=UPI003D25BFC8
MGTAGASQLTGVAAGTAPTDAVNVSQLQAVAAIANDAVLYDNASHASVTLGGVGGSVALGSGAQASGAGSSAVGANALRPRPTRSRSVRAPSPATRTRCRSARSVTNGRSRTSRRASVRPTQSTCSSWTRFSRG